MADREERIRQRAHEIWEMEGRPDGRDQEHWERAHREIDAKSSEIPPGQANEARPPDDPPAGKSKPGQTVPTKPSRAKR